MGLEFMRIPRRLPAGTRLVIEGRAGHIHLRCLEFPDGRRIVLPTDPAEQAIARRARPGTRKSSARSSPKKKLPVAGTTRCLAS
jgi:hypothetical protein